MMRLDGNHRFTFKYDGISHSVFRDGSGPGVLLMHEAPGMSDRCLALADRLIGAGFTAYLPLFFGKPGMDNKLAGPALVVLCLRRELNSLATNAPSEIAGWLRALCRRIHNESHGRGVGVIGMCLTGNLVLSVMLDESVLVPVLCEPAVPFVPWSKKRKAALGVPDDDVKRAAERAKQVQVLGFRFETDTKCPDERFQTLEQIFGTTCFKGKRIPTGPSNPGQIPNGSHSVLTGEFDYDDLNHPARKALDEIIEQLQTLFPERVSNVFIAR
jgi:dienelactone hydrolase